ncbi:MAG: hypothetical protein LBV20_00030 [Treponema sp.]|nr:hypothetical protein [Treponema sp.]
MLLFSILCFHVAAPFAAAESAASALFHVPPITGSGITDDDNDFVFNLVSDEILLRDYSLAASPDRADFIVTGSLSPYEDDNWYYDQVFVLKLTLFNNKTGILMIEQEIIYSTQEDLSGIFPSIMHSIFALIPAQNDAELRTNELLYLGVNAFWSPRTYSGIYESIYLMNFGFAVEVEYNLLDYLSLGIGAELTTDWIMASAIDSHQAVVLGIPLLVKGFFMSRSDDFVLQPYTGIQLNLSFHKALKPSLFTGIIGFQYGVRFGPGFFYIDPRVSLDFSESRLILNDTEVFRRHIIHVGLGYKIGFFAKGKK